MLSRFTTGDSLVFTTALADYPASAGWVLYYRLIPRSGSGSPVSFGSVASSDRHFISVPAATTAAWLAGTYTWASWVSNGTASHSTGNGSTDLLPNPRTALGAIDLRTAAQVGLDNVRATIQGKATADVLSYQINGRSLARYPMAELIALESNLAGRVAAERRAAALAAGKPDPRRYTVSLGRA